jgi:hypothetical protein
MDEQHDLTTRRTMLAETEAQITSETLRFEQSIAPLRKRADQLRQAYAQALKTELARVEVPRAKPDLTKILAGLERSHQPIIIGRIRDLAAKYTATRQPQPHRTEQSATPNLEGGPAGA